MLHIRTLYTIVLETYTKTNVTFFRGEDKRLALVQSSIHKTPVGSVHPSASHSASLAVLSDNMPLYTTVSYR